MLLYSSILKIMFQNYINVRKTNFKISKNNFSNYFALLKFLVYYSNAVIIFISQN